MIDRRSFLQLSAAAGFGSMLTSRARAATTPPAPAPNGRIPVAFVLSDGAVMIDFAGPWEVFQDVRLPDPDAGFRLFTVGETTAPIRASAGMRIVPEYTFANAPDPKVIVIPAQNGNPALLDWIRAKAKTADITAAVCTGAFILAKTGLLAGRSATTHHGSYLQLANAYPDVKVVRGARFVDQGNLATSGGLSSGIDLALHIVERYYGRDVARQTADQMEYQGLGWTDPNSNAQYAVARQSTDAKPLCPICSMDVEPATAPSSVYNAKTYYFCTLPHKAQFDEAPDKWAKSGR